MTSAPAHESIFAAAVIAQCVFLVIIAAGGLILRHFGCVREGTAAAWLGLVSGSLGLGVLAFSSCVTDLWARLLGKLAVPSLSIVTSVGCALVINIVIATMLIRLSGGTKVSPFKELYFFLPVLSIFLRQPLTFVVGYTIGAAV